MPIIVSVAVALFYVLSVLSQLVSGKPSSTSSFTRTTSTKHGSTSTIPSPTATIARKNPKRGIAYASDVAGDVINANQTASVISWQYDWANLPPAYLATSNIKYIPMQWGAGSIDKLVDAVRAQGADTVLGYNEPDFSEESNIDPTEAARLWMQYIQPLKAYGVKLGAPAVTAAGTGRPWLQKFFAACSQCTIDFLPIHWYGSGTAGFYDYLWAIRAEHPNVPVWVTEYADTSDNATEVLTFMNDTMRYLDELEWVERYAWFGFFRPKTGIHYNLLKDDGGLNALGELYTGAKTVHTEIVSDAAFAEYQTVVGTDTAGQPLVTSWPVYEPSNGALRAASSALSYRTAFLGLSIISAVAIGGVW
ncbi:glycosyl hydrolase catalytic core-domain-containing protein [Ephemerocybe angulata]|uniref:Glycosyl hydrolase catalytic core-domain-containing protein n=1 Tax=Ephemerocybe angulata TaxID=980116 RepID=A0A8H6HXM5_9AGAR|nr:glycosyl hydrolase catalytic core-domain-containing protein [Tulosesus angulatus]